MGRPKSRITGRSTRRTDDVVSLSKRNAHRRAIRKDGRGLPQVAADRTIRPKHGLNARGWRGVFAPSRFLFVSATVNWGGAGCWGRTLNQNFVRMNMTSTISWSLLWSFIRQGRYTVENREYLPTYAENASVVVVCVLF